VLRAPGAYDPFNQPSSTEVRPTALGYGFRLPPKSLAWSWYGSVTSLDAEPIRRPSRKKTIRRLWTNGKAKRTFGH